MKLYTSNRQEILFDRLVELLNQAPADPFVPEIILVQSQGMERWLRQELALRTGVWANGRFPFPNSALRELLEKALPGQPESLLFSAEYLGWRLFSLLSGVLVEPAFLEVARYLEDDPAGLKRWQLAQRISAVFDNYLLYRPDLLLEWESGSEPDWQALLWRKLVKECGSAHRAALRAEFLSRIRAPDFSATGLPRRISIFGIPYLPPLHLELFAAAGRHMEVHLFLLLPSQEDWTGPAAAGRSAPSAPRTALNPPEESGFDFQAGNPLLASWGKPAAEFSQQLLQPTRPSMVTAEFEAPGQEKLLHCLQSDILFNRQRSAGPGGTGTAWRQDGSIQFHACHSPTRETEVLHDHLLELFERMPELEPRDILVMIPDIEGYAPYIEAVFGTTRDERKRIPYSVADRNPALESPYIQAFFKLLELKNSRFEATRVLDLLGLPPVLWRFRLQAGDFDRILFWVKETGIRWGKNAEDRARHDLPEFAENSWEQGLRRMLLGLAMPEDGEPIFEGVLPYGEIEGNSSLLLGRFLDFIRQLMDSMRALEHPRTLAEWAENFRTLAGLFLADDQEGQAGGEALLLQLLALEEIQEKTGCTERLSLELVRSHLEQALRREEFNREFLSGRVTFCSMIPMRSIPFRVVALLGMNHDQFPRSEHRLPFDRMGHSARPGDRSLRDEHRHLFLEALLSARDCLYISYLGQSIKDNSAVPPSVLVSELLDYLQRGFSADDTLDPLDAWVVRQRLQPFSPSYFSPAENSAGLFSFSEENYAALATEPDRRWWELPFLSAPLGDPGESYRRVELETLKRFFRNPVAFFFQQRLGMFLEPDQTGLEDSEPLEPNQLTQYGIENDLIAQLLAGKQEARASAAVKLRGVLPPAAVGQACLDTLEMNSRAVAGELLSRISPLRPEAADVALQIGPFLVTGRIAGIRESELLRFRPAKAKPKDFLSAWIDYLALRCQGRPGDPQKCLLLATEDEQLQQWIFESVEEPSRLLETLLGIYWRGLCEPLPLFPEAGMAYAEACHRGGTAEAAVEAARKAWEDNHYGTRAAEREEPYHKLAFGHIQAIGSEFEAVAKSVWLPLLQHRISRG